MDIFDALNAGEPVAEEVVPDIFDTLNAGEPEVEEAVPDIFDAISPTAPTDFAEVSSDVRSDVSPTPLKPGLAEAMRGLEIAERGWPNLTPAEKEEWRTIEIEGVAKMGPGNPVLHGGVLSHYGKAGTAISSLVSDLIEGKDRPPTAFESAQEASARGLTSSAEPWKRVLGETLPALTVDAPLYAAMNYLTLGFGTFSAMNLLDQGLDAINTGAKFESDEVKQSLLTDAIFKAVPALGLLKQMKLNPGAFKAGAKEGIPAKQVAEMLKSGGLRKRVAAELKELAIKGGLITGSSTAAQFSNNEEITWESTLATATESFALATATHLKPLAKQAQAGLIESAAIKGGMPPADAVYFSNRLVHNKPGDAMKMAVESFKGDKGQIRKFAAAFRAEYGEAGVVGRERFKQKKTTDARMEADRLRRAKETFKGTTSELPAPAKGPTAETIILSHTKTQGMKVGAEAPIFGTKGQQFPAKYAVVPRAELVASHDPLSFSKNQNYPVKNSRDYSNPAEQAKVLDVRNRFSAARHVTDSPDAAVGPSMVARVTDQKGVSSLVVLGGNNREMAISLLSAEQKTELEDYTNQRLDRFGVPALEDGEALVRFMGDFDLRKADEKLAVESLIDSLNPSPGKVQNLSEVAGVDAVTLPIETIAQLPAVITPADAQSFINAAIASGGLDLNLRSQLAEKPAQAVEYVKRLQMQAATQSSLVTDFSAGNARNGVAVRGLFDAAVPALLEMRQKGAGQMANSFALSFETILNDFEKVGRLPAALKKAAEQMDMDPQYAVANLVARAMHQAVVTNSRGSIDTTASVEGFEALWTRIHNTMKQYTSVADIFGAQRSPEEAVRALLVDPVPSEQSLAVHDEQGAFNLDSSGQEEFSFDYEKRDDQLTPAQAAAQEDAERGTVDVLRRHSGTLLGSALAKEFKETKGVAALVGKRVESGADLAAIAQVYRNPSFETFRIVYARKGKVVLETGVTSRLPAMAAVFAKGTGMDAVRQEIRETMQRLGADKFWFLHNHPSGTMKPSGADLQVSRKLSKDISGYDGHVIINHTRFVFINKSHAAHIFDLQTTPLENQYDSNSPVLPHSLLDLVVQDPTSLARVAAEFERVADESKFELIGVSTKGLTSGLMTVPTELLENASRVKLLASLRNFMRGTGSSRVFAVNVPIRYSARYEVFGHAINAGALTDVLFLDQNGEYVSAFGDLRFISHSGHTAGRWMEENEGTAVKEDSPFYNTTPMAEQPYAVRLTESGKKKSGDIKSWQQVKLGGLEFVRPVEMPELLKFAKMLNVEPQLVTHRNGVRGSLRTRDGVKDSPEITLDRRIFKIPHQAARTLGHEIGHLIDFLPTATLKRGNLVGRLTSIQNFRKRVMGTMDNKELTDELFAVTKWWRPFDSGEVTESYLAYRKSSRELYADAISVLFNAPAELQTRAPKFWKHFFDQIEKKPEVKRDVLELWDYLNRGDVARLKDRSADVHKMFARGEEIMLRKAKERTLRHNSFRGWSDRFLQQYSDIYHPAIKASRKAKAAGKVLTWDQDPEYFLNEHPLAAGNVTYRIMDRVYKKVVEPLESEGLDLATLGEYLFFNRVLTEKGTTKGSARGEIANPLGMEKPQAAAGLFHLRQSLKMESMTALKQYAELFQDIVFETTEDAVKAGTSTADFVEQELRPNKHAYAAFAVLDHLEHNDKIPAGIRKQLGTLKDVANPFTATLIKTMALARWNQYNKAKLGTIDLLSTSFGEATRAPVSKNGNRIVPKPAPNGKELFMVMRNGQQEWWYVEPEMNKMFESQTPATADSVLQVLNTTFKQIFYPMWITYNPAFNLFMNPVRDFRRTQRNIPIKSNIKSSVKLMNEYRKNYKSARKRLLHEADPLIAEMMDNFAIGSPYDSFTSNLYREDSFEKMLEDFKFRPPAEQAAWKKTKIVKPAIKLLKTIEFYGNIFETLPKIASYKILTKDLHMPPREAAHYVRNVLGTPNYMIKGTHISVAGNVIPFANIFVQGWKSDAHTAFKNPKTRAGWWYKWASTNGMATVLKAAAATGLLGVGLKELFAGIGEHDKTSYDILPLGTVNAGMFGKKTAYLRLPKDETSRFLDAVMYKALVSMFSSDEGSKQWSDVFAIGAGQFPGVHPAVKMSEGWGQYLSGKNPMDHFYDRPILTNDQWLEGGWEGTKGMLQWSGQQMGLSNFVRYNQNADTTLEAALYSTPVLNKVFKISDYGHREKQQQTEETTDKERAIVRNALPTDVASARREYYLLRAIRSDVRTPQQTERYQDLHEWYRTEFSPAWEEILSALEQDDIKRAKKIAISINYE